MANRIGNITTKKKLRHDIMEKKNMSKNTKNESSNRDNFSDEWGFVGGIDDEAPVDELLLPDNTAESALNCAFIG